MNGYKTLRLCDTQKNDMRTVSRHPRHEEYA